MDIDEEQSSQYKFCYSKKNFNSLVMLKRPQKIIDLIIERENRHMFWYSSSLDHDIATTIEEHSYEKVTVSLFNDITDILNKFQQDVSLQNVCLACSEDDLLSSDVQKLIRNQKITTICCYFTDELTEDGLKIAACGKSSILVQKKQAVISQFYSRQCMCSKYKILPNFIALKDVGTSNVLIRTIYCMINQNIELQTREALVEELSEVFDKMIQLKSCNIESLSDVEVFINQLRIGNLTATKAIYWYTYESPIFRIVNAFLRVSRFSTMTFYLQPYFRDLFLAIRNQFLQQNKKSNWIQFTCYRGGKIEQSEAEYLRNNIGEIVQNLGFFSTSIDNQIAKQYIDNAYFEIKVVNNIPANENDHDYGYAWIAKLSNFFGQQQIIFNPMSSFIVKDVTKNEQENKYYIKLEYTKLNKLDPKSKAYKKYKALYSYQSEMKKSTLHQGNVLMNDAQNIYEAIIYWKKYLKLAKSQDMTFEAYKVLSLLQKYSYKYSQSSKYITKALQLTDESSKLGRYRFIQMIHYQIDLLIKMKKMSEAFEMCTNFVQSQQANQNLDILALMLQQLGDLYFGKGKYNESLQSYSKCLYIKYKIFGLDQVQCTQTLNKIAAVKYTFGDYEQAKQLLQKSQDILADILGCEHTYYINNVKQWARMYISKHQFQKAQEIYDQCMKIQQKKSDMVNLAITYIQTGSVWKYRGEVQKAIQYFNKSLKIIDFQLGEENQFSIFTLTRIAYVYKDQRKFNLALPLLEKAQKTIQKLYGKDNLQYLRTLFSIGSIYRNQGKYFDALKSLTECRIGFITCSYCHIGLYQQIINELASIYLSLNMLDKAQGFLRELNLRPNYYPYKYFMAFNLIRYTKMCAIQKQTDEALQICRWVRSIFNNPLCQVDYIQFYLWLGKIFNNLGSYVQARQLYINVDKVLRKYCNQIRESKRHYLEMLWLMVQNLQKMGDKQSNEYKIVNKNLQKLAHLSYQTFSREYEMQLDWPQSSYQKPQPIYLDFLQ